MYGKKPAIFLDVLPSSRENVNGDQLLCVTGDGYIFIFPIKKDLKEYLFFSTQSAQPIIPTLNKNKNFPNTKLAITDILAHTLTTKPQCIGHFKVDKDSPPIRAEMSRDKKYLMVHGMIYKKVPSIGIFLLKSQSVELVFVDTMLGLIDMCFHSNQNVILALPRVFMGTISMLTLPPVMPDHFQHRLIPQITFSDLKTCRSFRITSCPNCSHYLFATWSDLVVPHISLWKMTSDNHDTRWLETALRFTQPSIISFLSFDSSGYKLGFVYRTENTVSLNVWDLKKEPNQQINMGIDIGEFGDLINAKWGRNCFSNVESFFALTSTGLFMHTGESVICWPQPETPMTDFCPIDGLLYYVNANGELRLISAHEGEPRAGSKDVLAKALPRVPYVKVMQKGKCDTAIGLHLHRCAYCRMPLISPLVCRDSDLECCYCSRDCQQKHWPTYVAVHKPYDLEQDPAHVFSSFVKERMRKS